MSNILLNADVLAPVRSETQVIGKVNKGSLKRGDTTSATSNWNTKYRSGLGIPEELKLYTGVRWVRMTGSNQSNSVDTIPREH